MKVKLERNWFAPSDIIGESLSSKSGQLFRAGEHNIDIRWKKHLPAGTVILDAPVTHEAHDVCAVKAPSKASKIKKEA